MYNYFTKRLKKKNRGFTLIEVIVVIGILAILAALAIPAIGGYLDRSKERTNQANARMIFNAANAYMASAPSADELDAITPAELKAKNYLESEPKTAGKGDSFDLNYDSDTKKFSVEWDPDTDGDEEVLIYPDDATPAISEE